AEVRFRDAGAVRGLLLGAVRQALHAAGHKAATTVAAQAYAAFAQQPFYARTAAAPANVHEEAFAYYAPPSSAPVMLLPETALPPQAREAMPAADPSHYPLGAARAQLHGTYIVAETQDGLVIVDQHAAHERLVYERMKAEMARGGIERQKLLIPE